MMSQFFENYRSSANLWATFFSCKMVHQIIIKNRVGLYFGRFFQKLLWSRRLQPSAPFPAGTVWVSV
jgi:hypothetical protein